ncbi:MAG: hypothetical protein MZV49_25030 [Rhodopseudomonas palustris]|nr:hypothetical protein [Rhodopseudomonas palustris]
MVAGQPGADAVLGGALIGGILFFAMLPGFLGLLRRPAGAGTCHLASLPSGAGVTADTGPSQRQRAPRRGARAGADGVDGSEIGRLCGPAVPAPGRRAAARRSWPLAAGLPDAGPSLRNGRRIRSRSSCG